MRPRPFHSRQCAVTALCVAGPERLAPPSLLFDPLVAAPAFIRGAPLLPSREVGRRKHRDSRDAQ
jgi:hypothetical protein